MKKGGHGMQKAIFSRIDLNNADNDLAEEYLGCISDLLHLDGVQDLKSFTQHMNTSRFQHSLNVSYYMHADSIWIPAVRQEPVCCMIFITMTGVTWIRRIARLKAGTVRFIRKLPWRMPARLPLSMPLSRMPSCIICGR